MKLAEAMAALEAAGTEQCRKIYLRHGMRAPLFGVSYGTLGKLQKAIRRDQALADALWATGNADARVLAAMIAEPAAAPLERWVRELDSYPNTGAFVKHAAAPAPGAFERALAWTLEDGEWIEAAGWSVLATLAMASGGGADDERWSPLIPRIERDLHGAKNRVRYSMNGALAAVGMRSEGLRTQALAAAGRIGPVEVDHGETGCETPDAARMIQRGWARKEAKGGAAPAKRSSRAGVPAPVTAGAPGGKATRAERSK